MTTHPPHTDPPGSRRRSRLVLVVDDEAALRRSLTLMLSDAGFETIEAEDGTLALDLVRAMRDEIAVVVLDVAMPNMDGIEAARRIRELRAEMPIVLMSGYPQEPIAGTLALAKPFDPETLLRILYRAIGGVSR
ncbi:MAG TPA: response regulator [Labilithrix sp.]|nr:response regulator [Labilithrix sp.]